MRALIERWGPFAACLLVAIGCQVLGLGLVKTGGWWILLAIPVLLVSLASWLLTTEAMTWTTRRRPSRRT